MEVELGSHSRMDCLVAELSLNSCFWDTVRGQEQGGGLGSPSWMDCHACRVVPRQLLFGHCLCDFAPHSC